MATLEACRRCCLCRPISGGPVLIVPYMWIADFARCHSVVRLLNERFPDRPVDVLTTAMVAPLLDYMPGVRNNVPRKRLAFCAHRALAASCGRKVMAMRR
jgi:heptosyltransferase II